MQQLEAKKASKALNQEILHKNHEIFRINQEKLKEWLALVYGNVLYFSEKKA
jgi:hypothetical protein